jgi:c-di-GMP-binding flagellar brake protein YcgR
MENTDLEQYMLYDKREIVRALNELANHRVTILMSIDSTHEKCLTSVISADFGDDLAYLDIGVDENFNNKLSQASEISLNIDHGVRVRCTMKNPKLVKLKDGLAIRVQLPDSLLKVQRREYCRFPVALSKNITCEIPIEKQKESDITREEIVSLQVANVSLGGICAYLNTEEASSELEALFTVGRDFENCKVDLQNNLKLSLMLRVRHFKSIGTTNNLIKYIVGFEFINPSRANQNLIHKFVFEMEHEFVLKQVKN